MDTSGQLSITHLILNASTLVQVVMLFLLSLSVASWTIIVSRSSAYKNARVKADEFEEKFWGNQDMESKDANLQLGEICRLGSANIKAL